MDAQNPPSMEENMPPMGEDPFQQPHPQASSPTLRRTSNRYSALNTQLFNSYQETSSPSHFKKILEARMSDVQRRLEEASSSGQSLVKEKQQISESLKEVEKIQNEREVGPELRARLEELEREYQEVGRESARAFFGSRRGHPSEDLSQDERVAGFRAASPTKFNARATDSPSKMSAVGSRKQRNVGGSRVHDIEFATEISTSLLAQVRQLQAALAERDEQLKDSQGDKERLELDLQTYGLRLKAMDENEQRYKDENWALETANHELLAAQKEAVQKEQRLQHSLAVANAEKTGAQRELDEIRQAYGKLNEETTMLRKAHESELGNLRRSMNLAEMDKTDLQRRLEEYTAQNQELANFISSRPKSTEPMLEHEHLEEPEDISLDKSDLEHTPPGSPVKGARNSLLESETLKSSLAHAHHMIQNLKRTVHREKTEKLELKRQLQESKDELDIRRQEAGAGGSKRARANRLSKQPSAGVFRASQLGGARAAGTEIIEGEWEDHDGIDTTPRRLAGPERSETKKDMSDAYATANETEGFETANETEGFDTANEREMSTENEFATGAESLAGDSTDELTEREDNANDNTVSVNRSGTIRGASGARQFTPQRPTHISRDSFHSTASTSDEDADAPTSMRSSRYSSVIFKSKPGGSRWSRQLVGPPSASTTSSVNNSPAPSVNAAVGAHSLGDELGDFMDEDDYGEAESMGDANTPSRSRGASRQVSRGTTPHKTRSRSQLNPLGDSIRLEPTPQHAVPPVPRVPMVDGSMMTEAWAPEVEIREIPMEVEIVREVPVEVVREVEKPVEVIKEVQVPFEVIKEVVKEVQVPVEVIKEVPTEVIKEVEVIREIKVPFEVVKEIEKPVEVIKEVPVEVIKEVQVPYEVIKEVIKEMPVETIREVIKEVPVEVVKEVKVPYEVVKEVQIPVEVIKEVPVETIKEVRVPGPETVKEVVKEVPFETVREVIKEVPVEKIKEVQVPVEVVREVQVPLEVIKEVQVPVEVTKEVPVEVIKEVQVPYEVIKEIEKPIEVIKEVPVEVIKEVQVPFEVIKEVQVPYEVVKEVKVPHEVIKEVQVPVEVIKEVHVPYEVVKEVQVPVEVIKEVQVPYEVVKEVQVPVEVVKEVQVPFEVVKEVPVEVIKEVQVPYEVIKEVQVPVEIIREVPVRQTPKSRDTAEAGTSMSPSKNAKEFVLPTPDETPANSVGSLPPRDANELNQDLRRPETTLFAPAPPDIDRRFQMSPVSSISVDPVNGDASRPGTAVKAAQSSPKEENFSFAQIYTPSNPPPRDAPETERSRPSTAVRNEFNGEQTMGNVAGGGLMGTTLGWLGGKDSNALLGQDDVSQQAQKRSQSPSKQPLGEVSNNVAGRAPLGEPSIPNRQLRRKESFREFSDEQLNISADSLEPSSSLTRSGRDGYTPDLPGPKPLLPAKSVRRPESVSSVRPVDVPPLPENHQRVIEAAAKRNTAELPKNVTMGSMGPPVAPASAYRNKEIRAYTPSEQATPSKYTGRASRPNGTKSLRSRRSSISSFESELDNRFDLRNGLSGMMGMGMDMGSTDPRMIQAITQTMIGEYLWKYTRKAGGTKMSQNRHRRFFWVHPYTRTLYWSEQDPTTAGRAQLKAKSVQIEAVRVVQDDNPFPPGLHRKSLIVLTPHGGRDLKFTAPTGMRHETWFNSLSYLLLRQNPDAVQDSVASHQDFNPTTTSAGRDGNPSAEPRASLSTYNSRPGTTRGSRASSITRGTRGVPDNIAQSSPATVRRYPPAASQQQGLMGPPRTPSRGVAAASGQDFAGKVPNSDSVRTSMSMASRISSVLRPGRASVSSQQARSHTGSRAGGDGSIYNASVVQSESAEDLRERYAQQMEEEGVENVRACCDGRHDVGSISRRAGSRVSHHH